VLASFEGEQLGPRHPGPECPRLGEGSGPVLRAVHDEVGAASCASGNESSLRVMATSFSVPASLCRTRASVSSSGCGADTWLTKDSKRDLTAGSEME